MAKFESMIPHILMWEEKIPAKMLKQAPEKIYASLGNIAHKEAGDSGGWTKAGVTLSTYAAFRKKQGFKTTSVEDLKRMPYADWVAIFKGMFWDKFRADEIKDANIAKACVDFMWHSGGNGVRKVQQVLGVTVDGIVGPKTIAAINGHNDRRELFEKIQTARRAYLNHIGRPGTANNRFLNGWLNRVNSIKYEC